MPKGTHHLPPPPALSRLLTPQFTSPLFLSQTHFSFSLSFITSNATIPFWDSRVRPSLQRLGVNGLGQGPQNHESRTWDLITDAALDATTHKIIRIKFHLSHPNSFHSFVPHQVSCSLSFLSSLTPHLSLLLFCCTSRSHSLSFSPTLPPSSVPVQILLPSYFRGDPLLKKTLHLKIRAALLRASTK